MLKKRRIANSNYPYTGDANLAFLARIVLDDYLTGKKDSSEVYFDNHLGQNGRELLEEFCFCIHEPDMNTDFLGAQDKLFKCIEEKSLSSRAFSFASKAMFGLQENLLFIAIVRLIKRSIDRAKGKGGLEPSFKMLQEDISAIEGSANPESKGVLLMFSCLLSDDYVVAHLLVREKYQQVINLRINDKGLTALAYAVMKEDEMLAVSLLGAGASLLGEDKDQLMLDMCKRESRASLFMSFVEFAQGSKSADSTCTPSNVKLLVIEAIEIKKYKFVDYLVRYLSSSDFKDTFSYAVHHADAQVLMLMLSCDKFFTEKINPINVTDSLGFTPYVYLLGHLERFRAEGDEEMLSMLETVAMLMERKGASVENIDKSDLANYQLDCLESDLLSSCNVTPLGAPSLLFSSFQNSPAALFYALGLVRKGANVNVIDEVSGKTPLAYAVLAVDKECVLLILKKLAECSNEQVCLPSAQVCKEFRGNTAAIELMRKLVSSMPTSENGLEQLRILLRHFNPEHAKFKLIDTFLKLKTLCKYSPCSWPGNSVGLIDNKCMDNIGGKIAVLIAKLSQHLIAGEGGVIVSFNIAMCALDCINACNKSGVSAKCNDIVGQLESASMFFHKKSDDTMVLKKAGSAPCLI